MQRLLLRMMGQEEVGLRIAQARDEAGLSQQELAERINLAQGQSISRYERGETEVPAKRLRRIAEATGKPMSFFVQEPDEVFTSPDRLSVMENEARNRHDETLARFDRLDEQLRILAATAAEIQTRLG